ncbi:hypothetical protein [Rhodococcus sp. ACPA1]|uniref:hypothetical protein n=1 Tax=Rhodococcus sp. ACPA1 TaxID=2028572 RepID=UPI000BB0EE09|nr:hypothetical protein [Rhodococcus sp. ACPA1]PBC57035.1 hypothetical protein CJ177_15790 [Rhodococcus sp. ACPA1]
MSDDFAAIVRDPRRESDRFAVFLAMVDVARGCDTATDGVNLRTKWEFYSHCADAIRCPEGDHLPLGRAAEEVGKEFVGFAMHKALDWREYYAHDGDLYYAPLVAALTNEIMDAMDALDRRLGEVWADIYDQFDPDLRAEAHTWPRQALWNGEDVEFVVDGISRAHAQRSVLLDENIPLVSEVLEIPTDVSDLDP